MSTVRALFAGVAVWTLASTGLPAMARPLSLNPSQSLAPTQGVPRDAVLVRLVSGAVSRSAPAGWQSVERGQWLRLGDAVRTAEQAMLVLELPEQAGFVHVLGGSELAISELRQLPGHDGPQAAIFTLNGGKAFVKLRSFNRERSRFQVQTPGGSAAVRGTAFVVDVDRAATARIGVSEGQVVVSARGQDIDLVPGHTSTIIPGQPPTSPTRHRTTPLRLTSFWPMGQQAQVSGRAAPGSTVMVNGLQVSVADDGAFVATVPLAPDLTQAVVEAIDPTGHIESVTVTGGGPLEP